MSKAGSTTASLTPTPAGWRLHFGAQPPREAENLGELTQFIPAATRVELSLPCFAVLMERLHLPATDRGELAGMVQLQLEKTLPYPVEEVTSAFEQVQQTESESTILSMAVHGPVLAAICQPLRDQEHVPSAISLLAHDLAPHLPTGGRVAAVWGEQGHLAIAIYEEGKLSWAYNLIGTDVETLRSDLPPLLLTAEVDGVPTNVEQVALAADCEELRGALGEIFGVPVGLFPIAEVVPRSELNLLPAEWGQAALDLEKAERLQQRLLAGAVAYLLLVAVAFVYLAWMKRQVQVLDVQVAQTRPAIQATQERQARWAALSPALQPNRFSVELLFLVNRNRGNDVHITDFSTSPAEFRVDGEAPNGEQAVDFAEKLRADKELTGFQIEAGQPKILANGRAQFQISGKL